VAVQSEAYVCIAGITGLNPTEGMDVYHLCWLCVVYVAASVMS
jgi:hypothetical protein